MNRAYVDQWLQAPGVQALFVWALCMSDAMRGPRVLFMCIRPLEHYDLGNGDQQAMIGASSGNLMHIQRTSLGEARLKMSRFSKTATSFGMGTSTHHAWKGIVTDANRFNVKNQRLQCCYITSVHCSGCEHMLSLSSSDRSCWRHAPSTMRALQAFVASVHSGRLQVLSTRRP